jgi:hypothetical protein
MVKAPSMDSRVTRTGNDVIDAAADLAVKGLARS